MGWLVWRTGRSSRELLGARPRRGAVGAWASVGGPIGGMGPNWQWEGRVMGARSDATRGVATGEWRSRAPTREGRAGGAGAGSSVSESPLYLGVHLTVHQWSKLH